MTLRMPQLICHADWSQNEKKRWFAEAILEIDGRYTVGSAKLVGNIVKFRAYILQQAGIARAAFLGCDFPIGIPLHYAQQAGITKLKDWLLKLGDGCWREFYEVCEQPGEITVHRPFYPGVTRKGVKQASLTVKLNANGINELKRVCELGGNGHRRAACLFWTVEPNQVGRAALAGWKEVIIPLLNDSSGHTTLWPFDGKLDDLIMPGKIVMAESYPAEYYAWFKQDGVVKSDRASRTAFGRSLLQWAEDRREKVILTNTLEQQIQSGFENDDAFDAVVGLFAMLKIVFAERDYRQPADTDRIAVEGWMLGRESISPGSA
jgi:hypothetical protein